MRTNLEVLISFDLIITTSIMQSAGERRGKELYEGTVSEF